MTLVSKTFELYGKTYTFESGELAKQATGACLVKQGDTTMLDTVVVSKERKNYDFFQLTVDFNGFERQGFAVQMQFARRVFAFRVRTSGKGARNECFFSIKIKFKLNVFEQMCRSAVVAAMNGLRHEVPSSQSAGRSNCPAGCSGFKHFEEF